jgi:hypothetical protein
MNEEEMMENEALESGMVHDLNLNPTIPLADASLDAAINSLSIEYLT